MPTKEEQQGYTYMALIDGEWQQVTIEESPVELLERFEKDEEWIRVRHGHWINHYDDIWPEESTMECSLCHEEQGRGMLDTNYCPHCGAKMDGKENTDG